MEKLKRNKGKLTKASEIISSVKDNLGIEDSLKINALKELWALVTSFEIAEHSQPAYFDKEGNLVIAVKNSSLSTELLMQKTTILKKLKEATKNTNIFFKDVRFIHRA